MKRVLAMILMFCMVFSLAACGSGAAGANEKEPKQNGGEQISEEDTIDDSAWDELTTIGQVETVNGLLTVSITFSADFAGEDVTQEALDAAAGEHYISAKLNEDGSVTYKMTKKQHKAMLDDILGGIEESLQDLVDDEMYSFAEIKHNKNYTQFDVTIDGEELGFADSFAVLAFYTYGGIYGIFSGKTPENIVVNFYNANGELINTAESSSLGN